MTGVSLKARRRLASLAVLLAASSVATCRLDDLLTPGEIGALAATPTELADSALAGSTALRQYDVALRVDGTGERLRFAVAAELGSSWIVLGPATGTAPGTYSLSVDPTGLAVGEYVDTIRFTAEGPDAKQLRVPVRFKLLPCTVTDLGGLPASVNGTLSTADCASPRFTDRFARRYRITALANDSITVQLGSTAFGPSVAIERVGTPAPLATSTSCSVAAAAACVRYLHLATAGDYIIEATTTGTRATGAFTLSASRPRPPTAPASLAQLTTTPPVAQVALAGTLSATQLSLQAAVSDPDGDSLRLEVELRPIGVALSGTATHTSALGAGTLAVTATGLTDGTAYRWRARAVDVTGRASAWTEFGGNAVDAPDFTVAVPEAPAAPTGLAQRKDDGVTDIALGGTTDESVVRLGATVTDNDPTDQIRLEVEVRPLGQALTNTATASSIPVTSGTFAVVAVSGLVDDVGYRWQVRAVDQTGRASAWVRFSPSGETFHVALPPTQLAFVVGPSAAAAGAAIGPAVQVAARDAGGATLTSFTGPITIALGDNPGSAALTGTLTANAVAGVATFADPRLDRAGTGYTLIASANAGALTTESDPFSIGAGSAQTLAFTVGPSAAVAGAPLAPAIVVSARDAFGNVATGFNGSVSLALGANGAGATLLGTTTVVAVNGIATFGSVRVERAATGLTLVASAGGFTDATSAAFAVSAASATTLRLTTPPSTTAAAGAPFAVQPVTVLEDQFGNRVATAGVVVSATIASGTGATLANAQATTDASGTATFSGLAITGPSGAYTIAFAASGLTGVSSGSITLAAGGPARLALATAALVAVTNGAAFPVAPVVRLEDAAGNAVALAGIPVTVALASGAPALSGTATVLTDANGEAAFTDLVITGATGVRTLAFSAVGLIGVTSGGIAVVAGPATEMLAVAGDGQSATAGSAVAIAPSVRVRDESQNPVAGVDVTFAVTAGGGSIVPATTVTTDANGLATLTSWTLGASVGTNTLEASVAGLTGSPVLFTATGTAGGATQLAISGGNNLTGPVGTMLGTAHEVRVTDANGNPVAGVSITWAAVGGGSVAPLASVTDADGRATAVRTLGGTAGTQSTTATTTIAGGPVTVTFTVTATVGGATQMALAGGDLQVDSVGSTLATPLSVLVRDALNNPVPGVLISWAVVDGGGSITPATSTTDAAGIATASWTLGTATSATDSTQLARASGVGSPVNFVATSRPGGVSVAQTTVAVSPASVAASRGTPATVTVTARDRFGNMVPGRTVTLTASGVGNTIVQPAAVTGANGITTGAIGATASGVRTIVASVDGLTVTQQPTLLVTAAPASAVVFTSVPATAVSGGSLTPAPEVGVVDSLGNRNFTFAGAITLGLAVNPVSGTLSGTLTRNAIAGVATFPGLALDRAGTGYVLVATSAGLNGATSGAIDVTAGGVSAARSLLTVSTGTLVAGLDTATITVTARDAADNPVAGATVTLAATGAASVLEQPLAVTDANGVATGRVSATLSGARTISATIGAVAVTQTQVVTVAPAAVSGTLSTLGALPATIAAGGPTSTVTVTARDAFGNVIPGATVVLAATGTGNTIVQPAATDANGQATGTLASTAAGTKTVTATVNGTPLTASADVVVGAGAVSSATSTIAIAPDTIIAGGAASTVTVTARDASGNPVAGATVVLASTGTGNTITQPVAVTDANGVATGTVAATASGSRTISATIGGTAVTATATLVVRPGAVSPALSTLSLDATSTTAGAAAIAVTATARDANGNLIPGLAVTFAATGTGNTLTQPAALTDANGRATGAIGSTDAGVKTVSATIDGVPVTQTADLTVTAGAVSAAQSTVVAAPAALSADGGTSTITVTARDASGNPIAGLAVVLAATGTGNTLTQPAALTDANGVATGTLASTAAGAKIVTATIDGTAIDQADTVTVAAGAVSAAQSSLVAAPDTLSADGGASTITVTARDANGNPVAGRTVVLAVTGSGNTLTQPVAVTDANGVATGALASTGAGAKVVSATIDAAPITARDTVVVTPGAFSATLSTIATSSPTISAAVGSATITVTARDANGNAIPGLAVVLAATGTGNTLTQPAAVTDATGIATGSLSSTVSEAKTVSATVGAVALVATTTVTVVPDAVSAARSTVSVAPGTISADGETATVTVTARDASGNPVAGVSVAISATGSGNTIVQPVGTTGANGIATGTIAATASGARTISATVNGVTVTQTAALTVTPGAVSATVSTVSADPATITAGGAPSTVTVTARDADGNVIPGLAVTFTASGAGNTLTQPAATTDASGIATGSFTSTAAGAKVVVATVGGVELTLRDTVTVTAAALSTTTSTIVATPTALTAGTGDASIAVTVRDAFNNPVAGVTVVLAATGTGNTLTQPAAVTDADGLATGTFASTGAGLKELTATLDGQALVARDTITVSAAGVSTTLSSIVAAPDSISTDGAASTITVTARDAFGNVVAGASVVLAATGAGNTLTQPAAVTDANGVATGSLTSTTVGSKVVTATVAGAALAPSDTVVVVPGAISAATSTVAAAPATIAADGGASTVTVTARDANGNPIPGVTVVLAATGAGNTITQPATVTDANGVTTGSLSSTAAGAKVVSATIGGVGVTQTDTVTVTAGNVSAALSTVVGAQPTSVAGAAATTVTVTARDASGNPVAGVVVTLAATGAGNTLTQPVGLTDANGVATGAITSTATGDKVVTATIDGVVATQTFTLAVSPAAVAAATSSVAAAPTSITAGGAGSTITVTARDQFSNVVPGATVVLAATGTGNTVTDPAAVTDVNGQATGSVASTVAGTKTVSATIDGVAVTATVDLTVTAGAVDAALSTVAAAPGTLSADGGASTITITARDANGNPVAGQAVTLAATGSGNTLTQPVGVTDANGQITGAISSTGAGTKTITATIGATVVTQTADVVVVAGAVTAAQSTVSAAPTSIVAGGAASTITVTARDQHGNAVSGASVTLAATGTNTLTQPSGTTDASGVITGTLASTQTGDKVVTATIGAVTVTQTATVTVTAAAVDAAQSTVAVSDATIAAGTGTSTVTVTARDQYGNAVPGAAVVIAATGSNNTITQPSGVTDASGIATGGFASTTSEAKTISATAAGVAITQTQVVTVVPDVASGTQSSVAVSAASFVAGDAGITVTVTARDGSGNPVSGVSVVVSATGTGTTITGPATTTDANGVATATLTSTGAGAKTVSATVNGVAVTQTQAVTVAPAAVDGTTSTVVAAPNSLSADGGASTITVTARDAFGNAVSGESVTLAATGAGNTLTQPVGTTDANGQIAGTLSSTASGAKVVSATIGAVAVTQTDTVTVAPGTVSAATSTVAADPATLTAGSGSSTITITARDANGNVLPGATVTLAVSGGGATLTQPAGVTDGNGVTTGSLAATTSGAKVVTATVNGVEVTQTATVTVGAGAVSAANSTVSADVTTLTAGAGSSTITVTARDANNNVIAGLAVVLAATGDGNTITQPVAVTDGNGVATGSVSSTGAGSKTVSTTVDGTPITQTVGLTVTAAALSDTASRVVASVADFVAGGGASVTFTARDAFGNPLEGLPVTFAVSGSGNTLTQPAALTDAAGQTTGSFTSTAAGQKIITATIDGTLIVHADTVVVTAGAVSAAVSTVAILPTTIASGGATTVTVTALDANGNPVAGQTVTLASTGADAVVTQPVAVTNAAGVATGSVSATVVGTKTI